MRTVPSKYLRLAQYIYNRYGVEEGNRILCRNNIELLFHVCKIKTA